MDWVAGNIYWTDPKFNVIEMARLNGSCRYVVVTGNVDKPTAIAVDPPNGFLFWSDAGREPRLERARLDGSQRIVLVNDTGNSINDIALDYEVRLLLHHHKNYHVKEIHEFWYHCTKMLLMQ